MSVRMLGLWMLVAGAVALTMAAGASAKTRVLELNNHDGEHVAVGSEAGMRLTVRAKTKLFHEWSNECSASSTAPGKVASNGAKTDAIKEFGFGVGSCTGGNSPGEEHMYNGIQEVVLGSNGKAKLFASGGPYYFDRWYLNLDRTGSGSKESCWYAVSEQKGSFSTSADAVTIEGTGKVRLAKEGYASSRECAVTVPISFTVELFEHEPESEYPLVPEIAT